MQDPAIAPDVEKPLVARPQPTQSLLQVAAFAGLARENSQPMARMATGRLVSVVIAVPRYVAFGTAKCMASHSDA